MECIYYPQYKNFDNQFDVLGSASKHCRALRIRIGEQILFTDGCGLTIKSELLSIGKESHRFRIIDQINNLGELPYKIGLAIGILDNRERFEFALEKSIELGISDFYPIICEYSQKKTIQKERLLSKAISAMEQCKRSVLPVIHEPFTIETTLKISQEYSQIYLSDENGSSILSEGNVKSNALIFVGPEGGFSNSEIEQIKSNEKTISINLGNRRLRAESAAIISVSILSLKQQIVV
jgi:16S rRNA (uracil1498-N3)-methyltransferase